MPSLATHGLEFLALKWTVCDKFSHWLRGHQFTVRTNNNPLTYILSKPKLDACEQRWVSKLAPWTLTSDTSLVLRMWWRMPSVVSLLCTPVFSGLTTVPYGALLEEANALKPDCAGCFSVVL